MTTFPPLSTQASRVREHVAPVPSQRIKWSYALARMTGAPDTWEEACRRVSLDDAPPGVADVLVVQVVEINRHKTMDLPGYQRTLLFDGDLLGMALADRYATRQFEAAVPESLDGELHFVCAGGVCGRVVGMPFDMLPPTQLRPLGYLRNADGSRVNLGDHALAPLPVPIAGIPMVVVVGASMDSGKTTAAFSLINGLTRAGIHVAAAKLTGTASAKDLRYFHDAGARRVLDFTDGGFGSTAHLSEAQLLTLADTLVTNLAADAPGCIVLEIADGATQRETVMMLRLLASAGVRHAIYTCNDSLGAAPGVARLRSYGYDVLAVSGTCTASPLSQREVQAEVDLPVLSKEELSSPLIGGRLGLFNPVAG